MDSKQPRTAMDELRTWFEVPAIAHYFHVFRDSYDLIDFDIEDFEETLLQDTENDSCFFPDLLICLLRGWFRIKDGVEVTMENYDYYLHDLLNFYNSLLQQRECPRFTLIVRFLSPRAKVGILYDMINWRLDVRDAMEQTKNLDADEMRVEPVGKDNNGYVYWYFYGSRLYKESLLVNNDEFADVSESELKNYTLKKRRMRRLPLSWSSSFHKKGIMNTISSSRESETETDKSELENGKWPERMKEPFELCQGDRPVLKKIIIETSSSFDESEAEVEKSLAELKNGLLKKRKKKTRKKRVVQNSSSSDESEIDSERSSEITDNDYDSCLHKKDDVRINLNDGVYNWSLCCSTVDEWKDLINNLRDATTRNEKLLLKNLEELFQKIPDIIKERERKQSEVGKAEVIKKQHKEREHLLEQTEMENSLCKETTKEESREANEVL